MNILSGRVWNEPLMAADTPAPTVTYACRYSHIYCKFLIKRNRDNLFERALCKLRLSIAFSWFKCHPNASTNSQCTETPPCRGRKEQREWKNWKNKHLLSHKVRAPKQSKVRVASRQGGRKKICLKQLHFSIIGFNCSQSPLQLCQPAGESSAQVRVVTASICERRSRAVKRRECGNGNKQFCAKVTSTTDNNNSSNNNS